MKEAQCVWSDHGGQGTCDETLAWRLEDRRPFCAGQSARAKALGGERDVSHRVTVEELEYKRAGSRRGA